ncbi:MAG: TraB/GumN family protein [Crocinitomicaceae bacterium]
MKLVQLSTLTFLICLPILGFSQKNNSKQEKSRYQSLLWEIKNPKTGENSYLYGTMHVSSKVAFHLTDSFYVALKNVDIVGLETNPEYWMEDMLKSDVYSFWLHNGFRIPTEGFYSNAFKLTPIDNRGFKYLLSVDSRFSNNLLYRKSYGYENNFQEDTYLDMFIYQAGKKLGKEVTNLEDFEESQKLVMESQMADAKNRSYGYRNQYDFGDKRPYEIIEDAYRNGDLDLLDSIGRITGTEEGREFMLYKRNENIAESIDSIIQGGQKIFAAVGAAHLPGNRGVIEEMRKKGYVVRPVFGSKNRDPKQKDAIDELIHPFSLKKIVAEDGSFSTYLPEKIIEAPEALVYKELQIPDMPNGGIYFIKQINTFAPLFDQSIDYMKKRIDSLLYENIPGKIVSIDQKGKDKYGHPIIFIKNETKQGNAQQYKIIITPFELFIFKVSGIKEYANRKDVQLFMDSTQLIYSYDQDWRAVSPHFEGFKVDLPGAVKIQDTRAFTSLNCNAFIQSFEKKSKSYFALIQTTLTDVQYIEEDTFELKYIADKFCEDLDFKKIQKGDFSKIDGYPSYSHYAENEKGDGMHVQTIINGPHYYLMIAKSNKKLADKYFKSFKFKDFKPSGEIPEIKDTLMLCKVATFAVNPRSEYDQIFNYGYGLNNEDEDNDFTAKYEDIEYFFNSTGEKLEVSYTKFHDYASRNPKKLYNPTNYMNEFIDLKYDQGEPHTTYVSEEGGDEFEAEDIGISGLDLKFGPEKDSPYLISKDRFIENPPNGLKWKEYEVHHQNSSRGIYGRYLVYKGRSYNLRVTIDTNAGPSREVLHFMDHFIPMDTVVGQPMGQDKDSLFIAHLTSKDSLLEMRALRSIYMIDFEGANADEMIQIIDTLNFKRFDKGHTYKLNLLQSLGEIDDPKILSYLEKKYDEAEDTSSLQIAILNGINQKETKENAELFVKLLLKETPLTKSYKINQLFDYYKDSIEIQKHYYPDLFALAGVPEYTDHVYSTLVQLLDSGHIEKEFYKEKLDDIYREAKMELKRFNNKTIDAENNKNLDYYDYDYDYSYDYEYDDYEDYEYGFGSGNRFTSFSNHKLAELMKLLAPYYKEDERVQKLFEKMMLINDIKGVCFTAVLLNKVGKKTTIDTWRNLQEKNPENQYMIYQVLLKLEEKEMMEDLGLTPKALAKAEILNLTNLNLREKDSLIQKEIIEMTYQDKPLLVYVFKYKKTQENKYSYGKQDDQWKLAMIAVKPEDEEEPILDDLTQINITIKLNKDENEIIQEKLKALRFLHRQRAVFEGNYEYDY